MKHYKTKACLLCSLFEKCTRNKTGRFIERSEHMDLIDANKKRLTENMKVYRQRQAIVEHPFGVIKRQWDFYSVMTKKTIKHASADVGLIFTCYNLRRIFNLIDQNLLQKFLGELGFLFLILSSHFKVICSTILNQTTLSPFQKMSIFMFLKRLYLSKKTVCLEVENEFLDELPLPASQYEPATSDNLNTKN